MDAVSPDSGPVNCRQFEFRVNYTDSNNDAPETDPLLYINLTGTPITGSPFTMLPVNATDLTYNDGKLYRYPHTFTSTGTGSDYQYYFAANDSWGIPAIGPATMVTDGPDVTVNNPPSVTVDMPALGDSISGGMAHNIMMTIGDLEDTIAPEFIMNLVLTYSVDDGPWDPITTPPHLNDIPSNLGMYSWDVPGSINSINVNVRANLTDSCGVMAGDESEQFEIDSQPPTPTPTPSDGAIDVPITSQIVIDFGEGMNTSSSSAFTLYNVTDGMTVVQGSPPLWSVGNSILTFTPSSLNQYTEYRIIVDTTALDDSYPGNNLATELNVTFRTADIELPEITITSQPASIGTGQTFQIQADVTDNAGVAIVNISWGMRGFVMTNYTMTLSGGLYGYTSPATPEGEYVDFIIWATDLSGNVNSTTIQSIEVTEAGCSIFGNITDEDNKPLSGVKVEVYDGTNKVGEDTTDSDGYYLITGLPCGDYELKISKSGYDTRELDVDTTNPDQGTLSIVKTPTDEFPWWIIIVIVVIIVVLLLVILLMRRKKPEEEEAAAEEEAEEEYEEEPAEEELEEEAEEELGEEEELAEEELEEEEERTE
jgi:hypothetical protein